MARPRKGTYPGLTVYNERWGNRIQHVVHKYSKYGLILGIYSDTFDMFVDELIKRCQNDQQNIVMCEGATGSGKSTLAIQLAIAMAKKMGTTFDLDHDYIYGASDMWNKLSTPGASPINLIDEGTVSLSNLNYRKNDDKDLIVLFDTMRSRHWTTFVCAPDIRQLNPSLRRLHIDFKLECSGPDNQFVKDYERGIFEVTNKKFSKRDRYDPEPYWNVLTAGVFGPLPPEIDKKYQKIKAGRQDMLIQGGIKKRMTGDE